MTINPFTEDSKIDLLYPADQSNLVIESNGSLINGLIEIAQGKGPHKTIILLHGFPGTEKNNDLAHIFRRAGFNVVIFSYRGSWGSQGDYSFKHSAEDVSNVISFIERNGEKYRCDVNNIILIGNSFGGFIALYSAVFHKNIRRVASISGWFLPITNQLMANGELYSESMKQLILESMNPLHGTTPEKLLEEIKNIDSWDFENFYYTLIDKDVCLVAGLKDDLVPAEFYHFPLVNDLEKINPDIKLTQTSFYDARHSYSDHRIKLAKYLLDWLQSG